MDTNSNENPGSKQDSGKRGVNGSILNTDASARETVMDQGHLPIAPDQKAELDRLDAYAIDKNPGRLASDVIADIRRRI